MRSARSGYPADDVEKLGPFGGDARIRHVAADEDEVERLRCVQGRQSVHRFDQAIVSARSGAPALDAEAIALADDMDVGQMRDTPDSGGGSRLVEGFEIERLVSGGVGEAPEQRGDREIGGHDDDRVGDRREHEGVRRHQVVDRADPLRRGPCDDGDRARHGEQEQAGGGAASRAQARKLGPGPALKGAFDQMPQRLAPECVAGLDRKRVQRPEVLLRHAKQGSPAEPGDGKGDENDQDGARSGGLRETDPRFSDPGGESERRKAEQHGRQQDRERPGEKELRQADLGEQAAEHRQKRALFRGGPVVPHVAPPRIENQRRGTAREARSIGFGGGIVHARCLPWRRPSRGRARAIASRRRTRYGNGFRRDVSSRPSWRGAKPSSGGLSPAAILPRAREGQKRKTPELSLRGLVSADRFTIRSNG